MLLKGYNKTRSFVIADCFHKLKTTEMIRTYSFTSNDIYIVNNNFRRISEKEFIKKRQKRLIKRINRIMTNQLSKQNSRKRLKFQTNN